MNNKDIDTSDYRHKVWEKEYQNRKNLPSSKTYFPSRALKNFLEQFNPNNRLTALDLGSGNGRNSIFLSYEGYEKVVGVEFVKSIVEEAKERVKKLDLEDKITFINQSLGVPIDYPDETFDLIIDMMVMHSLTKEDREVMISEVKRLLKPNGYFIFYTIAAESEAALDLMKKMKGPEDNSYRFKVESDIVTEKAFTENELKTMFDPLELILIEAKEEFTPAFGDVFKRLYYYGVFRKDN